MLLTQATQADRDPAALRRLTGALAALVILWPLFKAAEVQPGALFDPDNLKVIGRFLATFLPPETSAEFLGYLGKAVVETLAIATGGMALAFAIALPLGCACMAWVWWMQPRKLANACAGGLLAVAFALPAAYHALPVIHYFAPFGSFYLNDIYWASGARLINIDFGPYGHYQYGSPSYFNPAFYPFSDWLTERTGTAFIRIDLTHGRQDWIAEAARVTHERTLSYAADAWQNFLYLCLGQTWPNNDPASRIGWLTVWMRWAWPVLVAWVAFGACTRRFKGREWLFPLGGLGLVALLLVQHNAIIEGRYRMPIDPLFVASAVILAYRRGRETTPPAPADAGAQDRRAGVSRGAAAVQHELGD